MRKKGQAWGFDLMIGSTIFLIGILFFYFFAINYPSENEESFQNLQHEGELVADSLLSEGSPVDWNVTNVVRIGLLSDGKINETKLEAFYYFARDDYNKTKGLFRVNSNYYIYFQENLSIGGQSVEGIGRKATSEENLVRVTRAVVYNNSIRSMNLNLWR